MRWTTWQLGFKVDRVPRFAKLISRPKQNRRQDSKAKRIQDDLIYTGLHTRHDHDAPRMK